MKIKMLRTLGVRFGSPAWRVEGVTYDVPKDEAADLIARGLAEEVSTPKKADDKKESDKK